MLLIHPLQRADRRAERMRDIGLCMSVRNEEANIVSCLAPIVDLFAQVVIVDTGSTDRTRDLLWDQFGIRAVVAELDPCVCYALSQVRNRGFDLLTTPWCMTLDADERIDRDQLQAVLTTDDDDLPAGLFCGWDTDFGDGQVMEDYKLALFRSDHRHHGLVHDTAQPCLRGAGTTAIWTEQIRIRHFPAFDRRKEKDDWYAWRLACAQQRDPTWLRYQWFSGYMAFRRGRLSQAEPLLRLAHEERPARFPVESLNASMVLAALHARRERRDQTRAVLDDALRHYRKVADDFEVAVNFRMGPWLEQAASDAARGNLESIQPYAFPY